MTTLNVTFPDLIENLSKAISAAHGTTYLVGGAVLDLIDRREPKDWDIEVFNLSYEAISDIASTFGKTDLIGQKFGVVKLKAQGIDIEMSIPRLESSIGPSHKDFNIKLVPHLSIYEAARRRDFTINALYLKIGNKKLHDPFGGYYDYRRGIITHIDSTKFKEDPLRAFRAMQIVSRKGKRVTHDTVQLCKSIKEDCRVLSGEAIFGEFTKMLKGSRPDKGLRFLEYSELIDLFPELKALIECKQNITHHPEGRVSAHTQMVVKEAAKYRSELPADWQLAYMFGMLLHDIGKPVVTDPVTLRSILHDVKGGPISRRFMEKLTNNERLISQVESIVSAHMRPVLFVRDGAKASAWRKLHNRCPLNILAYVSIADSDGRGFPRTAKTGKESDIFKECMHMYEVFGSHQDDIPSILKGRHLIAAGLKPGKAFGVMINKAYEYQLETGCEDVEELIEVATA